MEKNLKLLLLGSFFLVSFISVKHNLTGKWTVYNSDGTSIGEYVEFHDDDTYNVYLTNGEIGERGYYKVEHHVFSIRNIKDYVCGAGYWGKYRLDFHGEDSSTLHLLKIRVPIEGMILWA